MHSMGLNQNEIMTRKEYLKKKKKEKRKNMLSSISGRTWFLALFIIAISCYVVYQFYIYNTKHRLVQTLPDEISSMKDYKIYYVSESYAYDSKNQLKSMSTTSNEKTVIDEGLGICDICVKNGSVYGIIDGSLVKINTNGKKNEVTVLAQKGVKGYSIYGEEVYVYLNGDDIETGLYSVNSKNEINKIISSEVLQLLVDKDSIYIVNKDKNIVKYNKDGSGMKQITNNTVSGIIEDDSNIYFVNIKDNNRIYRIEKSTDKISKVTDSASTLNSYNTMNGYSYMNVYDDSIYYINTKDSNKLYRTKIGKGADEKILDDNIQILDVINGTIFYKVNGDIGVYRYDIVNKISSQITSARVVEFKAQG